MTTTLSNYLEFIDFFLFYTGTIGSQVESNGNNNHNEEAEIDPKFDVKFDSIDWQADNPEDNLTIEEIDDLRGTTRTRRGK